MSALDRFPPFDDTGGGTSVRPILNTLNGSYAGRTIPTWLDPNNDHGQLTILKMEGVGGPLPNRPCLLRTSVEKWIGGKIVGGFPEGRGISYALKIRNPKHVEKLLTMKVLADGTNIKISKHPNLNKSKCVVSCFEAKDTSDQELKENLAPQGVTDFRRIKRRIGHEQYENTASIILTFDGTVIPDHVDFGWLRCKTRPYYPAPMQCFCCWSFGHTRTRCKQPQSTCGNCSQDHPFDETNKCDNEPFCKRCNMHNHSLSSRKCPTYVEENTIQRIRIDMGISYHSAKKVFEQSNSSRTFSAVTSAGKDETIANLSKKVDQLLLEMTNKDKRIASLEATLNNKGKESSRLDLVRQHGTIEDLITEVVKLKSDLAMKDRENYLLRELYGKKVPQPEEPISPKSTNSIFSQQSTPSPEYEPIMQNNEEQTRSWVQRAQPNVSTKEKKQRIKNKKPSSSVESDCSTLIPSLALKDKTPKRTHLPTDSDDSTGRSKSKITANNSINISVISSGEEGADMES
ncbi:uncharacterized protein LOC134214535 [Armigeres subalbatus]|uniref:uncharacterized protein LOC134214535 n=1 Tax=Armigeres subalbatus TaxID=124917 RepID=UPI002ED5AB9F